MEKTTKEIKDERIDINEFEKIAGIIVDVAKGPGKLLEIKKWLILSGVNLLIIAAIIAAAIERF